MNLLTGQYQSCDECHRPAVYLVDLGRMDAHGHIDQESGANLCADCLRAAVALIEAEEEEPTTNEVQQ